MIQEAVKRDDAVTVYTLLQTYPQHRFHDNGTEQWMSMAVNNGLLNVLKLLVSLGADVTAPANITDKVPKPEGPIFFAATAGHLDMVRYMLDQGAPLNHEVEGRVRCFALSGAAQRGHLNLVRLLVERGAAVNGCWADRTALDGALESGEDEVVEYLRSVGAKTAAELAAGG